MARSSLGYVKIQFVNCAQLMKKNPEIHYTNNKGKEFIIRITSAIEIPQPYNLFRKV
jgi:hypothetical protein